MIRQKLNRLLKRNVAPNGFDGVFETFEKAAMAAPTGKTLGYDNANAGSWYRDKLNRVQFDDYPMLHWFEKSIQDGRKVVEIGGHVGVAYYAFSQLVQYPADLTWTIVDVPSVTHAGEELARERHRTNLRFVNNLEDITEPVDVLMASGSLQYVPGALLPERIRAMTAKPRHIIIHNTPVRPQHGYITLQNIGTVWCPYRIHGYDELIAPLVDLGYKLVDDWGKDRSVVIPRRPELRVDRYSGYYLRHPNASEHAFE
jgi:putative methyltransferase (TIGR04325 family)